MLSDDFMTSRINARAFATVEREAELLRRAGERREALRRKEGSGGVVRRPVAERPAAELPVAEIAAVEPPAVAGPVSAEPVRELAPAGC